MNSPSLIALAFILSNIVPLEAMAAPSTQSRNASGGRAVGLTIAQDGAIWVADERNAAILRIAIDRQCTKSDG